MKIKYKILLIISLLIFFFSIVFIIVHYNNQKKALLDGIDSKLQTVAYFANDILPKNYHDKIIDQSSVSKEEYLKIVSQYNRLCLKLNIQYIWSVLIHNDQVVFTSGTSTSKDVSKGDYALFFDIHTNPKAFKTAFQTMKIQHSSFHNKWGDGRMVLIPQFDRKGRKFIFGASMSINDVSTKLHETVLNSLFIGLYMLLGGIFFSFIIAYSLSQPLEKLEYTATNIAKGKLNQNVEIKGGHELVSLSKSINYMSQSISEKIFKIETHNQTLEHEIKERKKAEELLRESKEKLALHVKHTPVGIIDFNTNSEMQSWNPACEKIFGYTADEMIGQNYNILISDEQQRSIYLVWNEISNEKVTENISDNIRKDGITIVCKWTNTLLKNEEGKIIGITALCEDITTQVKHKEALETTIEKRTQELMIAKEEAEFADRAKSEFLSNISHEIRTPVHQILSYSKFGVDKIDKVKKDKLFHYFSKIGTVGKNLLALMNNLLDLSKLESGKMDYNMEMTHLQNIVSNTIGEFNSLIDEKGLILEKSIARSISPINCDEIKIGQVVRNLISNAIKFTPRGKKISVTVKPYELPINNKKLVPAVSIIVSDQGIGIPVDELETVFDKFIQSSKTKTGAGGTGLGLAICKEIIQAHNGKIWAENNPEGGATFSFMLPYEQNAE
jgi:PAS domain S-box-containing protein